MIAVAKENTSRHREIARREFGVGFVIAPHRFKRVPSVPVHQSGKLRSIYLYEVALGFKLYLGSIGERDCQATRPFVADHAGKPPTHSGKVKALAALTMNRLGRIKPYLAVRVIDQF